MQCSMRRRQRDRQRQTNHLVNWTQALRKATSTPMHLHRGPPGGCAAVDSRSRAAGLERSMPLALQCQDGLLGWVVVRPVEPALQAKGVGWGVTRAPLISV